MKGLLEVQHAGMGNAIQDMGRFGYRHMGVALSGHLDPLLARCANALVGNDTHAACIEIRLFGPTLKVIDGPVQVVTVGNLAPKVHRANGQQGPAPAWASLTLEAGDELEIGSVESGIAYLAVRGGITTPLQLGSRSTYQRALIGGLDGRLLVQGHRLPTGPVCEPLQNVRVAPPLSMPDGPIRLLLGPQDKHFQPEAVDELLSTTYTLTPQMDRMGMRLQGKALLHRTPACADIVSDGVTPGAIQVPGNGQPIILLADCQTVGGYPKIGTVISADLPRLAQLRPGQTLCFRAVNSTEAKTALIEQEALWQAWAHSIQSSTPNVAATPDDPDFCYAAI